MSLTKVTNSMIAGALVNVLDYGADPTDNAATATATTAAIQAALDTGKPIYIPTGTYYINGPLTSSSDIYGDGMNQSVLMCDTTAHTGNFLQTSNYQHIDGIGLQGTSTAAGTGLYVATNAGFAFIVNISNVSISGFNLGCDISEAAFVNFDFMHIYSNVMGMKCDPTFDGGDTGYATTVTLNKVYIRANTDYGLKFNAAVKCPQINLTDCVIESNTGSVSGYQAYIANCRINIDNLYQEGSAAIPSIRFGSGNDVSINGIYLSGTGGLDFGSGTNSVNINRFHGATAGDCVVATGASLQSINISNSALGANTNITCNVQTYLTRAAAGGSLVLKGFRAGLSVQSTEIATTNVTQVEQIAGYSKTVTATINANTTSALITNQSVNSIWNSDTVGIASLANLYHPGLILTVTVATTKSKSFFCVLATNTTGSNITVTDGELKVLFIRCNTMTAI
jgi:hypothetical protein